MAEADPALSYSRMNPLSDLAVWLTPSASASRS